MSGKVRGTADKEAADSGVPRWVVDLEIYLIPFQFLGFRVGGTDSGAAPGGASVASHEKIDKVKNNNNVTDSYVCICIIRWRLQLSLNWVISVN